MGRQHFLAAAALAMRRILVDWARKKGTLKRGSSLVRIDLEQFEPMLNTRPDVVLAIDETLSQLAVRDAQAAKVAELRLFSELTFEEIALSLSISRSQANRKRPTERWAQFTRSGRAVYESKPRS